MTAATSSLALVSRAEGEWLTAEQVRELAGWSNSVFYRRRHELVSRVSSETGANGRAVTLYLASSLPTDCQLRPEPKAASVLAMPSLGPLFQGAAPASSYPVVLTDPEAQKQAAERNGILQPLIDFIADPRAFAHLRLADGRAVDSQERMIAWLCAQHNNISPPTLKRWLARFREGGFAALSDRARSDRGSSRWMLQDERRRTIAEIAAYAYLEEKLSKTVAWEVACAEARRHNIEPPSYETIRALLDNVPAPVRTLALKGRRKYEELFAPYVRRGYDDFEAGEILVSDHAIHDVLVQNDLYGAKNREHMRLRFTGLLCMRSRKLVAYAWSEEGSSRSIASCLRSYVLRNGLFRVLYCDNGKDYQKVGRGASSAAWAIEQVAPETLGVLARLGIAVQYCIKFHPQSKLIERFNNTMHQRLDRRFVTYCGPTPEQRPDRCIAALERHQKLLGKGCPEDSDLPLASEFIRGAIAWIEGEYNQRAKDVPGMAGLTPNDAFEQFRWTAQPPAPAPEDLIPLLAERAQCAVRECTIQFRGRRYEPADAVGWQRMHHSTTGSVLIAYDPLDLDQVAAIDDAGRLIATLRPERLLRQSADEETSTAIAASMETRHTLARGVREDLAALGRRVRQAGYVPQHEQMRALGRLPIDIAGVVVERPGKIALSPEPTTNNLVPGDAADRLAERLRRKSSE